MLRFQSLSHNRLRLHKLRLRNIKNHLISRFFKELNVLKKIDSLGAAACIMALLQNIPSPLSAEGNKKNEASQKENPNYAIVDEPWKTDQNFPGRNRKIAVFTNAPYPANGITHLYNFGEFLYWSSGYDLDYAVVGTDPSTLQRTLYTFDKNFQPGLRLGMGYEFFPQGWDIRADWVCFHNKIEKTLRSGSTSIFNTWFSKNLFKISLKARL